MKKRAQCAGWLVLGFVVSAATALYGQTDPDLKLVVATVSGDNLTLADLQKQEGGKLLQAEYQYYLNERKALEDLIDNKLLADEAARRNMSLDQLMEKVVYENV